MTFDVSEFHDFYKHNDLFEDVIFKYCYNKDNIPIIKYKKDGTIIEIESGVFNDKNFSVISGILFVYPRLNHEYSCNVLDSEEKLFSSNFILLINPNVEIKIQDKQI